MTTQNTDQLKAFNPNNPNNEAPEEQLPDQRVLDAQQDRGLADGADQIPGAGSLGRGEKETDGSSDSGVAGDSGSFHDTGPAGGAGTGTGGASGGIITGSGASDGGRISDPA